jgi:hypothetical protein
MHQQDKVTKPRLQRRKLVTLPKLMTNLQRPSIEHSYSKTQTLQEIIQQIVQKLQGATNEKNRAVDEMIAQLKKLAPYIMAWTKEAKDALNTQTIPSERSSGEITVYLLVHYRSKYIECSMSRVNNYKCAMQAFEDEKDYEAIQTLEPITQSIDNLYTDFKDSIQSFTPENNEEFINIINKLPIQYGIEANLLTTEYIKALIKEKGLAQDLEKIASIYPNSP